MNLEWRLTYVGSAESEKYDQVLDTVFVGPVAPGQYRFVFQADPPDFSKIPSADIVGVTEFIRVGYYVNTEYEDEALREMPPEVPKLELSILADKPRVTKFPIEWDTAKESKDSAMSQDMDMEEVEE
ncbi:hypothetical protein QBZ16_001987 [Prototheca wickerhamii]|uniref:Uncharacterized protein n=1 Tax=Prototheca wickerhamii TaxID=3111 RepID=A0AAD9MJA4_PROWI|nr:hypothetical protein QBZ16_001987 [Prototheca wickerhamii]